MEGNIRIKHRILATFNINKNKINLSDCMPLSYIIHVLVLYQGDVFVCRIETVSNQGPIKLKQVITWRCIQ
jgi:hypothetical protein